MATSADKCTPPPHAMCRRVIAITFISRLCPHLQPLVDGLSCSELSRLKALELLGGDGLFEL